MVILILILLVIPSDIAVAASATPADPNATAKTKALLQYLTDLPNRSSNKILSGQYDDEDGMPETVGAYSSAGKWAALLGKDYHQRKWGDTAQNSEIIAWDANNGIATITIWYDNPDGTDLWSGVQSGISLTEMTTPGGTYNSWLNTKLDADAVLLQQLEDANVPVILRVFPEMNGSWSWYGAKGGTEFTKLWVYAFNRFTQHHGLHNLLFFYCPDKSLSNAATYYPGSAYVDIVGFDIYELGTDMSSLVSRYNTYIALGKPFAIGEYGYQGSWAGSGPLSDYPRQDLNAFITSIQTYMPKTVFWMNWNGSPNAVFSLKYNNVNLDDLFNNSKVITRDEVSYHRYNDCTYYRCEVRHWLRYSNEQSLRYQLRLNLLSGLYRRYNSHDDCNTSIRSFFCRLVWRWLFRYRVMHRNHEYEYGCYRDVHGTPSAKQLYFGYFEIRNRYGGCFHYSIRNLLWFLLFINIYERHSDYVNGNT